MIIEHALLTVEPGRGAEFETAFGEARTIIAAMPGFRELMLLRSIESPGAYLLLVEWDRLEDHTVGFRQSADYQRWKSLLHHFYDPFPDVSHFRPVLWDAGRCSEHREVRGDLKGDGHQGVHAGSDDLE